VKVVISFSMRFKMALNDSWSGQRAVNTSRKLRMSVVLIFLLGKFLSMTVLFFQENFRAKLTQQRKKALIK
jgi:hypothetical protein